VKKAVSGGATTLYPSADAEYTGSTWMRYPHMDVKVVGSAKQVLHRDHLASVRFVTDAAGALVEQTGYAAYGEKTNAAFATSKSYIGERFDAETGLLYLNARYHDPAFGRFISPDDWDPVLEGVWTNRYAYAQNDPINKADNNGHVALVDDAIGMFVGLAIGYVVVDLGDDGKLNHSPLPGLQGLVEDIVGPVFSEESAEADESGREPGSTNTDLGRGFTMGPFGQVYSPTGKLTTEEDEDVPASVPTDATKEQLEDEFDNISQSLGQRAVEQQEGSRAPGVVKCHEDRISREEAYRDVVKDALDALSESEDD